MLHFTEARDSEWQWHQLGRMQVCTSLQTDNHASTPLLSFFRPDALPVAQPTASKRLKAPKGILRRNGVENFKGIRYRYPPHLRPLNFSAVVAAMHVSELL